MKKIIFRILFILLFPLFANAQGNSSFVTNLEFEHANEVYPQKCVQMKNGNYLILSNYYFPGPGGDYSFTEISVKGKKIRDFKFPMGNFYPYDVERFYYFENGDIFFYGWGDKNHLLETGFNFMYDKKGDLKWTRNDFSIHSHFTTVFSPIDSSFFGRSCYTKYNQEKQEYENQYGFCIKLDYYGNILWQIDSLVFYDSILKDTLFFKSLYNLFIYDSFYYFILARGKDYRRMIKMSLDGDIVKIDTFRFPFNTKDLTMSFQKTEDGYLFQLRKWIDDYESQIVKLDDSFNTKWQYQLPIDHPVYASDIIIDEFGNIHLLLVHNVEYLSDLETYFEIRKLNPDGELLDSKKYFYIYLNGNIIDIHGSSLLLTRDGGYLISASMGYGWELGYVIKTDSNGYVDDKKIKCVSIKNEVHKNRNAIAYPNPFKTNCTFKLPTNTKQKVTLNLYSITGKLLKQEKFTGNSYEFFRGNLSNGLYLYQIILENKIFTGKLIVGDY
ncbi:MAG: T9SS type A sorting domain-containing protein [Bacteroidota bacterium]|nr:T9SS type A sorting domain-containing protein [Bacteroidota bacterium]